ncbi:MAG: hypothetical protein A2V67_03195 [Deltaproteobacteria bacterium RBG_13_61_14]|nr:MAG: hypothetical protein A2V67_03195 [Deltaproteobacteria bacterium RBG_13_61_14]
MQVFFSSHDCAALGRELGPNGKEAKSQRNKTLGVFRFLVSASSLFLLTLATLRLSVKFFFQPGIKSSPLGQGFQP